MSDAPPDEVEAEARRLLRDLISRLPWYPGLSADERTKRIEEDVDRWWLLKIEEAADRLAERERRPITPYGGVVRDGPEGTWTSGRTPKRRV